jgi:hypothetical protein
MEIIAYTHNSCNSKNPIPIKVETLSFWKNKECKHPITKENIEEFLNYNEYEFILGVSSSLAKSNERVFMDEFVDFIHISY